MNTNIYFKSIFGSTKKYANWLQEATSASLFKLNKISTENINTADNIIIMSGTYAGQMPLVKTLENNWNSLKDKNVIVIAIGAAKANDKQSEISYKLIPAEIRKNIKYFKLPGQTLNSVKNCVKKDNLSPIIEILEEK